MNIYHVTERGEPAVCKAKIKECPLGGAHYNSADSAREAYENEMCENTLSFAVSKQNSKTAPPVSHKEYSSDEIENLVPGFVAEREGVWTEQELLVDDLIDDETASADEFDSADLQHIDELAERYKAGERLNNLVCEENFLGGVDLLDGNHRVHAARKAGIKTLRVFVLEEE